MTQPEDLQIQSASVLTQTLLGLINKSGTVNWATQRIDDLHQFILNNVPYGVVDPKNLQQGLIELDGPAATNPARPQVPLQWHFGGVPYAIDKAIRVQYTYSKAVGDTQYDESGSLFIGYNFDESTKKQHAAKLGTSPSTGSALLSSPSLTLEQLAATLDRLRQENSVALVAARADNLDVFIRDENPLRTERPLTYLTPANPTNGKPPKANHMFRVSYDGPAQQNFSYDPFPYTRATLYQDREKFGELLHWYFGGRAYQITKAIWLRHLSATGEPDPECLFIGFQGPGGQP